MRARTVGLLIAAGALAAACAQGRARPPTPPPPASSGPSDAPPGDPRVAEAKKLDTEIEKLWDQGRFAQAIPIAERALALRQAALGPEHPEVAESLKDLAILCEKSGALERAEPLHLRALAIREKVFGPNHPTTAESLNQLANLLVARGALERAEPLLLRALRIREAALPPDHRDVARSLNGLANLYLSMDAYDRAEPLLLRALAIREKALGPNHPDVATILNNLAVLAREIGDYPRAESLHQRALAIREQALGPDHPETARSLENLGMLYLWMHRTDRAEALVTRALRIEEKRLGPDHMDVARSLNHLATVYWGRGELDRVRPLLERALVAREKALGPAHPEVAESLQNLGVLDLAQGSFDRAEARLRDAIARQEKALGPTHPELAGPLGKLGLVAMFKGRPAEAAALFRRSLALTERLLRSVGTVATGARMSAFLDTLHDDELFMLGLAARFPDDPDARRLALEVALLRKGRSIDEAADTARAVRQGLGPEDRQRLDRLQALRSRLGRAMLAGPIRTTAADREGRIAELEKQAEALEQELATRSAALRALRQLPKPDEIVARVAAALPQDGALVDVVAYRPIRLRGGHDVGGELRYLALVLRPSGDVRLAELGRASILDAAVERLQAALVHPEGAWRGPAQELDRLLERPLAPLLGDRRQLLLSLDGPLQLVPFGALWDGRRFLMDRYAMSTLTSGRDLLRPLPERPQGGAAPVVVLADPAFEEAPGPGAPASPEVLLASSRRDRALRLGSIPPLPGTRREAEEIRRLIPSARLLLGREATESALLGVQAPRVLHVATHGLFLDAPAPPGRGSARALALVGGEEAQEEAPERALLRSALVLAGAAALGRTPPDPARPDAGDGLATALEMSGMNLWGTELVVLSACDTGRGAIRLGQGVYGMRRALLIAGARTLVTSLWKVDDEVTQALMSRFYQNLLGGIGVGAALDEAARAVRARHPHPYYWAPFVVVGRSGPVEALAGR